MSGRSYRNKEPTRRFDGSDVFRQPHFWLSDLHATQTYPAIEERAKTSHTVEWCDVWFYQRIASGRRCSCHALGATPYMACPVCFMPDTLVRTTRGWVPIQDVVVGDFVMTSKGDYNKVKSVHSRPYTGHLRTVTSTVSPGPLWVTPEHPFYGLISVRHRQEPCGPKTCDRIIARGDGVPKPSKPSRRGRDRWQMRVTAPGMPPKQGRFHLGVYSTAAAAQAAAKEYLDSHYLPQHTLGWRTAESIHEDDWLVPVWDRRPDQDLEQITVPRQFTDKRERGKRQGSIVFQADEDFFWVMGLYLAEGSAGKRQVTFSLHEDEVDLQYRVRAFFQRYGYNTSVSQRPGSHGLDVNVYGTTLAQWLPNFLGAHCHEKRIPEDWMRLPRAKAWALLSGIYAGDNGGENTVTQTSKVLALQIGEILHRLGYQPLLRSVQAKALTPNVNSRLPAYVVSWERGDAYKGTRKGRWPFKSEALLSRVRRASRSHTVYSGQVYNLEVENDPTYVVEGLLVHNCFQTGIPGGYLKWGTTQAMVDCTLPGLALNGIRRAEVKSAGPLVLALEDGVLDGMAVATVEIGGGDAETVSFTQWDEEGSNIAWDFQTPAMYPADRWDSLTVANLTKRLGDAVQVVRIRLRLHRASIATPGPLVARAYVRTRRAPEDHTAVKISRPRIQHQLALAELGVTDDWQVQRWWADATLPRITDEDWFYEVEARRAWKVIDIDRHAPQNHTLDYDFSLRKVQDGEAILGYPP